MVVDTFSGPLSTYNPVDILQIYSGLSQRFCSYYKQLCLKTVSSCRPVRLLRPLLPSHRAKFFPLISVILYPSKYADTTGGFTPSLPAFWPRSPSLCFNAGYTYATWTQSFRIMLDAGFALPSHTSGIVTYPVPGAPCFEHERLKLWSAFSTGKYIRTRVGSNDDAGDNNAVSSW